MGNVAQVAAHTDLVYVRRIVRASSPALAGVVAPYLDKADAYIDEAVAAAVPAGPTAAGVPADPTYTVPPPGGVYAWDKALAGDLPTAPVIVDTFGALQQAAEVAMGTRAPDAGSPTEWATQAAAAETLREFIIGVVGDGESYYPSTMYPPIPARVFVAAGVEGSDTDVSAATVTALVASVQDQLRADGETIIPRPEQVQGAH